MGCIFFSRGSNLLFLHLQVELLTLSLQGSLSGLRQERKFWIEKLITNSAEELNFSRTRFQTEFLARWGILSFLYISDFYQKNFLIWWGFWRSHRRILPFFLLAMPLKRRLPNSQLRNLVLSDKPLGIPEQWLRFRSQTMLIWIVSSHKEESVPQKSELVIISAALFSQVKSICIIACLEL